MRNWNWHMENYWKPREPPYFITSKIAAIIKGTQLLRLEGRKIPLTVSLWENALAVVLHEVWRHELTTFTSFLWNFFNLFLGFWQFFLLHLNYLMCNSNLSAPISKEDMTKLLTVGYNRLAVEFSAKPLWALGSLSVRIKWEHICTQYVALLLRGRIAVA